MPQLNINKELIKYIEKYAHPLSGSMREYDPIIKAAKDKNIVLIGESTHGTKEFYKARAEITLRLIEEENYDAVAVEADWADAYTINRYLSGLYDISPNESLRDFERFPSWMWRNEEVLKFIRWLYSYNHEYHLKTRTKTRPVGFYGLDIYGINASINAVINYLQKVDHIAAKNARVRYSCLDHFVKNPQAYGYGVKLNIIKSCEEKIIEQLVELRKNSYKYLKKNGFLAEDEYFCAEQNAKLVLKGEEYYRSLFNPAVSSWNLRDKQMFETIESLKKHLSNKLNKEAKIVVWAHNSHIGNASATEMSQVGEVNIGQLAKQNFANKSLLVGFSTSLGTVTAASDWDGPTENKKINRPFNGSYEEVFHHVNHKKFLLDLTADNEAVDLLREGRLQRAIGVVYRPKTERYSHYFYSCLPEQFDFILHYDVTNAVKPLDAQQNWPIGDDMDETYPSGL